MMQAALLWRTATETEPRLTVHALPTELNKLTEKPRQSFGACLHSTEFNDVFTANGNRWGQSL
jgi:hypothetical protein